MEKWKAEEKTKNGMKDMNAIYHQAFLKSPSLIVVSDFDLGIFLQVNLAFTKVLGYSACEAIGHTASELSLFLENERYKEVAAEIKTLGKIENVRLKVRDKSGNILSGLFSAEVYVHNNQKVIITTMTDMTKFENQQQRIRKNFEHLNLMIEYLADAVWIINRKGVILDVNLKASFDSGYSKEEIIGRNIDTIDPTIKDGEFSLIFDKLLEQGVLHYIGKHIRKNGSIIDIEANATTIEMDGEILDICTTRDITTNKAFEAQILAAQTLLIEQKQILEEKNKALEMSEHRNRAIVNVLPDMLFVYDSEGYFVDCQTNNESNLLMSIESFIGKHMSEIMPAEISSNGLECIKRTLSNNSLESFEYTLDIAGEQKHYETRMVRSSDNEVLAIVRDITASKQEQELILKLSYKDSLTGLYNRRYFDEYFQSINEFSCLPTAILMIDVNGLKLTNDAFGHLAGDDLLKNVSKVLLEKTPKGAVISRIGGDEFVIVITKYAYEKCQELVESIYQAIGNIHHLDVVVSVSVGWEIRQMMEVSLRETLIQAENHMFRKKLVESQSMRHQTVAAILNTLNAKNKREKLHSEQVSILSKRVAEAMGFSSQVVKEIEITGLLHDIGKIAVGEELLNKPGKLTEEEFEEVRKHCESGYHILKTVDEYSSLADDILAHHEKMDGSGYPRGLKGDDIPIVARIIAVAEAYEAMVSDRSYRLGMSRKFALEELKRCSGSQFDPEIVNVFIGLFLKNK